MSRARQTQVPETAGVPRWTNRRHASGEAASKRQRSAATSWVPGTWLATLAFLALVTFVAFVVGMLTPVAWALQDTTTPQPASSSVAEAARDGAVVKPDNANGAVVAGAGGEETRTARQGREALEEMSYAPWYDSEKDELKRVNVKPPVKWTWLERIRDFFQNLEGPDWDFSGLRTLFDGLGIFAQACIYLLLIALLVGLSYLLLWVFSRIRDRRRQDDEEEEGDEEYLRRARVDELPLQLAAPKGDFLAEARRRYESGDYSGAIIYLFSHELLQLDRHQRIQLERGKTNRQYLREVRGEPFLANALSRTMVAFEDVFFGHHALDRSRFEACWREVEEFHRRLPVGAAS
jgi:hypothetical protein